MKLSAQGRAGRSIKPTTCVFLTAQRLRALLFVTGPEIRWIAALKLLVTAAAAEGEGAVALKNQVGSVPDSVGLVLTRSLTLARAPSSDLYQLLLNFTALFTVLSSLSFEAAVDRAQCSSVHSMSDMATAFCYFKVSASSYVHLWHVGNMNASVDHCAELAARFNACV
jgi:hypothetical protein